MGFVKIHCWEIRCDGCGEAFLSSETDLPAWFESKDEAIKAVPEFDGRIVREKVYCSACLWGRECDECGEVLGKRLKKSSDGRWLCKKCETKIQKEA